MSESGAPVPWSPSDTEDVRAQALEVLSDTFSWKLAEERWPEIGRVLVTMAAAVETGDMAALDAATARLELAGPLRIIPIGATAGPPPQARDLLTKLVHALGGVTTQRQPREPGDAGAANVGSPRG
jgi:hypothetical protein